MVISVSLTGSSADRLVDTEFELEVYFILKRLFDVSVSAILLFLLSPLLIIVSIAIFVSSPGPVIFTQKRLTKNSKIFTMYKFRSMKFDAEKNTGAVWAGENDNRITSFGSFIRKTRIDELPQLINVIKGDMSLIGPRPERPEIASELEKQYPYFNKRLATLAGITGYAQVQVGYVADVDSYKYKLDYDLEYIRKQSIMLDLQIALKTILVVITGSGAR